MLISRNCDLLTILPARRVYRMNNVAILITRRYRRIEVKSLTLSDQRKADPIGKKWLRQIPSMLFQKLPITA